ncbi:hypothetical protein [Microbulbifer mangrovi]|uniref:hypothetical protein n=1 Tax=Microbulbifer mangrovi TaxID=927787 RepID=UPI00117CFF56|nr:hypothetical protein [Microbulbifer mangrovi]
MQQKQKVILHIGRHKAGSTAIQEFLLRNDEFLRSNGYFYPLNMRLGRGHHELAQPLNQWRGKLSSWLKRPELNQKLQQELDENIHLTPIFSSEALQNSPPKAIKRLFSNFEVKIIVYLRNHIDYLASAYTQWVHATPYTGSIERYYLTSYSVNYWQFLRRWAQEFPTNLVVRRFEKSEFHQNDLVQDFLIHGPELEISPHCTNVEIDPNPSLNSKVLQFKSHINRTGQYREFEKHRLYQALPQLNKEFPAPKYTIPRELSQKLIRKNRDRDNFVARYFFGTETLFNYGPQDAQPEEQITEQEIDRMLRKLKSCIRS